MARRLSWWWLLLAVAGFLVVAGIAAVAFVTHSYSRYYEQGVIPPVDELVAPEPTEVHDAAGEPVARLDPAAVRGNVELESLPDHVVDAFLAAEDRGFFDHSGYSVWAVTRAFFANLFGGGIEQGGSTITQQYVDVAIADIPRTYRGKLREMALAAKLEDNLPKQRILELYLNAVSFGRGNVGLEAAAQTYFNVAATELTVNQAATLAGIVAAPTRFDPVRHPGAADERRVYVLRGMREQGWIDAPTASRLIAEGLPEVSGETPIDYGPHSYYVAAVHKELESVLPGRDVSVGLKVFTELDVRLQRLAQETLAEHLADATYTGAVATIDNRDGAVRALVGGLDYREQQFNAATQGENQAGSAFKPFALAAFLDAGHPPTTRFPAPPRMEVAFPGGERYEVRNFDDDGFGEQTVVEATLTSTNVVYAQIAAAVGPDSVERTAIRAGIDDDDDLLPVPSLVLGTSEVTVLNMAEAYTTFANDGVRRGPRLVSRVETADGEVVYEAPREEKRAIDPTVARTVTAVLRGNVEQGTGTAAQLGRPAAGKTGTTNDSRDAWFVGYVPQVTTAVWVGRLDNAPMGDVTGGSVPARIWGAYMKRALAPLPAAPLPAWSPQRAAAPTAPPTPGPTVPRTAPTP